MNYVFVHIKISYCWFNWSEILQKANDRHHNCGCKEKAAEYYPKNKDVSKEKARNKYKMKQKKNMVRTGIKKKKKKKKKKAESVSSSFLYIIKRCKKTLKFVMLICNFTLLSNQLL